MKISHSFLILILLNIAGLLGMAGIIYFLGQTEQEYYEQTDVLIEMKGFLIQKGYMEKMTLNNVPSFGNAERLDAEIQRHLSLLDGKLFPGRGRRLASLKEKLASRSILVQSVLKIHGELRTRMDQVKRFEEHMLTIEEAGPHLRTGLVAGRLQFSETPPYSDPGNMEDYLGALREILDRAEKEQPGSPFTVTLETYFTLVSELNSFLGNIRDSQIDDIVSLYETDDEVLLLIDGLTGDLQNSIEKREAQEKYTILSGILVIVFISIWTTALLGRSISRPIDRLRAYVKSIDLNNLANKTGDGELNSVNIKSLEISQLAESYLHLEKTLTEKMTELEERSANLSRELKERRKTERKLKQTERYLNNILQSLSSPIITTDNELMLTQTNQPADELAVSDDPDLFGRFPLLRPFEKEIRNVLSESANWFDLAIELPEQKGRYFNISATPLRGEKSNGVVIRLDDITRIKSMENQLIETQKWETLGVLTSGFAHDFNNVLTGIVTSSSILLHKAQNNYPELDQSFTECLNIIDRSGNRAAAMVQQLLSLSRSNELKFSPIDLKQSLEDVKAICRNSFDKSVTFETDFPDGKIIVNADNAQIEQIFLNLCINSYHAMTEMRDKKDKQGGCLKLSLNKVFIDKYTQIDEEGLAPGEYAAVSISDNGVGIPGDRQKKIFDPFFTTKDRSKGTGLGLTMVKHIVNQHSGFIKLYSETGRGTVVTVYLPLGSEDPEIVPVEDRARELIHGKGTILVIDDEEVLRVLTGSILHECGYKVIVAEDGFKGVDAYRKNASAIDLVILDMSMPGISGKETFIELKQINPEVKILMASGFIRDDRIMDLQNLGLEDFIQKPFDFIELSRKVAGILDF